MKPSMYNQLADITNLFYQTKDYQQEAKFIHQISQKSKINGKKILDVACGNGRHLQEFAKLGYKTFGNDLNPGMLKIAKQNHPQAKYWQQDMKKINPPEKFDLIVCLFNTINYNFGLKELTATLRQWHRLLNPGGLVVFDTMFTQDSWIDGHFSIQQLSQPNLDVARISKSRRVRNRGVVDITYLVFRSHQKEVIETENEIYIFNKKDIIEALQSAGFTPEGKNKSFQTKKGLAKMFVGRKD